MMLKRILFFNFLTAIVLKTYDARFRMNSSRGRFGVFLITFGLVLVLPFGTITADDTRPVTNNGKRWRFGYYEGGPYVNYPLHLRGLIKGLAELGWVEQTVVPDLDKIVLELMPGGAAETIDPSNTTLLWKWLAKNIKSKYIQFVESACWSANWDRTQRRKNQREAIEVLKKQELDLIIAMGTWAGLDLANNEHSVPTMVISTSDPVGAGIVKGSRYSGYTHVHARNDPARYLRQLRLFHAIVGFKNLGVVYENTPEGRAYASTADIEQVARERDFKITYCEAPFSGVEKEAATRAVIKCHTQLAEKVDAVYITVHRGVCVEAMNEILEPLLKNKIPTFSQRGILETKYGVLYCVDRESFDILCKYYATIIAKILRGSNPGDLDQRFEEPKKIVINLDTAKKIDYNPPQNILKVADIIYTETEGMK